MYFSTVIAFAALPFLVVAVPTSLKSLRTDRPISIPLSKRSNFLNRDGFAHPENGQAGLDHASARFEQARDADEINTGKTYPLELKRADSDNPVFASVSLKSASLMVTLDIEVGTPRKTYTVSLDSTTPDMLLGGNSNVCSTCFGQHRYDASISSSAIVDTNRTSTTANFGLGEVTGSVVGDTVYVDGNKVIDQEILVATSINPSLQHFTLDGVVGLGLGKASSFGEESYFESVIAYGRVVPAEILVGLHLTPSGGELIVGGRDSSKYTGDLVYIDIDPDAKFWQMQLNSIAIDGTTVVTDKEAIIDTSGLFITGDSETITKIYSNIPNSARIPNSGTFQVPCDVEIPITIDLGGSTFELPDVSTAVPLNKVISTADDNLCFGPYAILDGISSTNIRFGLTFLDRYYIEFDIKNKKVGLAKSIVNQSGTVNQGPVTPAVTSQAAKSSN